MRALVAVKLASVERMNGSFMEGKAKFGMGISFCFNVLKTFCSSGVHRKGDLLLLALYNGRAWSGYISEVFHIATVTGAQDHERFDVGWTCGT